MQTQGQNQPLYLQAEIVDVDDAPSPEESGVYDQQQVQEVITETDSYITLLRGIAQGAVLSGFQVTSTQSLYLAGCTGLFPAVIAGLPVGASLAATLCYLRFENSIVPTITNRQKFALSITRTAILAASSYKLTGDARQMEAIARESFGIFTAQLREYEGIKQPESSNFGLIMSLTAVLAVGLALFLKKK